MKALVTGANGLIGSSLIRELIRLGYEVRAFVRPESNLCSLAGIPVEIAYGDVLALESLAVASRGCELLFHTAAIFAYSGHRPADLEAVAVRGILNAIDAAHRARLSRVVLTSSSVVFGSGEQPSVRDEHATFCDPDPPPYVSAKLAQLQAAFQRATDLAIDLVAVCPTMSVGPRGYRLGPSNALIVSYLNDPYRFTFPGGCNIVSTLDVARGHILAAEAGSPGLAYLVGAENLTWAQVHRTISELCGLPGPFVEMNRTGCYLAGAYDEIRSRLLRRQPTTTRAEAKMVGRYYWYSHDRLSALGFMPESARQALAEAISWLAASAHISRETRATLSLSPEVYASRRRLSDYDMRGEAAT